MRIILTSIQFLIALFSYSQQPDIAPKRETKPVNTLFIDGYEGKDTVDVDHFKTGFRLKISDTNYTITQFNACWDDEAGDINCVPVQGDSFYIANKISRYRYPYPGALFTIDDIRATAHGRNVRLPSMIIYVRDLNNKYPTLINPRICHNNKQQLSCYNDGRYSFQFDKNIFTGFRTVDSLVRYSEKEKFFWIRNTTPVNPVDSFITMQFKKGALIFKSGAFEKKFDTLYDGVLDINGFKFEFTNHSRYTDSVKFTAGIKRFHIEISRLFKHPRWSIVERHGDRLFYISYDYKKGRPQHVSIQDQYLKYGMVVHTRFKTHRRTWWIESSFTDEWQEGEFRVIGSIPLTPSYYYRYNRFGKLRKKKVRGTIKYCDCR